MINQIVYSSSEEYSPLMATSIISLLVNNPHNSFDFTILDNGMSDKTKQDVTRMIESKGSSVKYVVIDDYSCLYDKKLEVHSLSLSTYARLLLTTILPCSISSVLYIDCDTIINGDLSEILNIDISAVGYAGVEDFMPLSEKRQAGLSEEVRYVNAGILIINLDYWRNNNVLSMFRNCITQFQGRVPYLDQGVLNITIPERIILPLKYNVQAPVLAFKSYDLMIKYYGLKQLYSSVEFMEAKEHPIVIHYTSFFMGRPWLSYCKHPLSYLFYKYYAMTGFSPIKRMGGVPFSIKLRGFLFRNFQKLYVNYKAK